MLSRLLAAVQIDPGGRGLANDPIDNLFTATAGQFERACESLARATHVAIVTGFFIPGATPPAFETDGPLGAWFLHRTLKSLGISSEIRSEPPVLRAIGLAFDSGDPSHVVFIERGGPGLDGIRRTMRGTDITDYLDPSFDLVPPDTVTIGIGDGGNEIGMGSIPHETIVRNIPNGDSIHCRVPVDHLIVAGVSNWGAYALGAGVAHVRGKSVPTHLHDPTYQLDVLRRMVAAGPLVDGVTGLPTATVDGLSWSDYTRPLEAIRDTLIS
jgi:hypothetical protein